MSTKGSGIIYIHKDGFQLYSSLYPTLFEFHFVPEIVRDLDVINEDLLKELIVLFITNNKIPPLMLVFVLADNACFIQDFTAAVPSDVSSQVEDFIDHVPFDTVTSKTFPLPNGVRALATNEALYDAIKAAFMKEEFVIDAILPGLPFGESISARSAIDIPTGALLLQKYNSLKEYNLTTHNPSTTIKQKEEVYENPDTQSNKNEVFKPDAGSDKQQEKKRIFLLVGVFLVLVVLLVIMYMQTQAV